mgnify:CR=1 FL=1
MKHLKHLTLSATLAALAAPAFAHHAAAVYYDTSKEVTMSGTVTEFRMGNPHARIYFEVVAADGTSKFAEDTDPTAINRLLENRRRRE